MKVTLVSIHIKKNAPEAVPLAAAMLKAACTDVADISLAEFALEDNESSIVSELEKERADAIGFSIYLWNREIARNVIEIIRTKHPSIILFAGGPDVTADISRFIKSTSVDFAISGEGENALREALKMINSTGAIENLHNIQGVGTKRFPNAEAAMFTKELSHISSPYLSGIIDVKKYSGVLWELSRGCPFQCAFCYESKGNPGIRQFPIERIEKELEFFEENGVEQIFVLDPTFNTDKQRAKQILQMIQNKAPHIHFTFEVRTEFLDKELAELFASVSCGLQIGLQSTNQAALSQINRKFDSNSYKKKIHVLTECAVIFGLDLIFGLPKDSFEHFCRSVDYAVNLQPNNLDIFRLAILPGTKLYDNAIKRENEIRFMTEPPYFVLGTPDFPEQDLIKAENLKNACDIFYNKGRAVGWLYIILETLKMAPSDFFLKFCDWLKKQNRFREQYSDDEIFQLQMRYTAFLFKQKNKAPLSLPVCDIIKLHNSLNASLIADGAPFTGKKRAYKLPPYTKLLELHYDVDDLFQAGITPLKYWIKKYKPRKTFAVIWNKNGNSDVMMIDKKWFELLKNCNHKKEFSAEEKEFLDYCVDEKIVI